MFIAKALVSYLFGSIIAPAVFALVSVITGLFTSYYFDLAPGGTIVLTSVIIMVATSVFKTQFKNRYQ